MSLKARPPGFGAGLFPVRSQLLGESCHGLWIRDCVVEPVANVEPTKEPTTTPRLFTHFQSVKAHRAATQHRELQPHGLHSPESDVFRPSSLNGYGLYRCFKKGYLQITLKSQAYRDASILPSKRLLATRSEVFLRLSNLGAFKRGGSPVSLFFVTTSPCREWVICVPAAFLGCGSRFSGSLSGIEP
ncbi:hypothetical protein GE061_020207 [Apolygus lucorum]|uniref:Uncharacterized protein n=1 Tax=Apolygus lucorum TaxID=248454 RepID=A0A8S9WJE2_APOLU|nr:hypothetical protein GE061_020207 [Apolygus lucorum]